MAHLKGSLAINPWRDIPLLRQILCSRGVSHSQLFEFMMLGNYESKRDAFNWRLRRFVEYGLVSKQTLSHASPESLYVITDSGNLCLESHGDFYLSESPFLNGKRLEGVSICHCLQLNDIQLALLRSKHLNQWIPEGRVLALMRLGTSPYAKAYDAKENPLGSRVFLDGHVSLRTLRDLLLEVPVRFQESLPFQSAGE